MADDRFHRTLVTDCGNGKLGKACSHVTDQAQRARLATPRMRAKPVASIAEHREILAALSTGSVEAAAPPSRSIGTGRAASIEAISNEEFAV